MSYVRDAHRRPGPRSSGREANARSERPNVRKALYEGIGTGDRAEHSAFNPAFSVVVILLEISLKNIGLLQSFCYLNVKHPTLTLCDAVLHMCGTSHHVLVIPGPERATGNTAGFKG